MTINWKKITKEAATATDKEYEQLISTLTSFKEKEVEQLILKTGISKQDLSKILQEVQNATKSNQAKAETIKNINKGIEVLVAIASKIV